MDKGIKKANYMRFEVSQILLKWITSISFGDNHTNNNPFLPIDRSTFNLTFNYLLATSIDSVRLFILRSFLWLYY